VEDGDALIRLVLVECLASSGKTREARIALDHAWTRLEERAATIDNPVWRTAFLTRIPDHKRTMDLAVAMGIRGRDVRSTADVA
jgi:hypothetical protein